MEDKTQNFFIRHPSAFRGPTAYMFKTTNFAWSKSGNRNTAFGTGRFASLGCLFAIRRGLLDAER